MEGQYKLVDFNHYCPLCKYYNKEEAKDPCNECLTYPAMVESSKPMHFKKNEKINKRKEK